MRFSTFWAKGGCSPQSVSAFTMVSSRNFGTEDKAISLGRPGSKAGLDKARSSGQLVCFVASNPCFVVLALELAGAKKQGAPPPLACLLARVERPRLPRILACCDAYYLALAFTLLCCR